MLSVQERKDQWAQFVEAVSSQLGIRVVLDIEVTRLQGPSGVVFQSVPVMRVVADEWPEAPTEDSTQRHKDAKAQSDFVEPQIKADSVEAGIEAVRTFNEEVNSILPEAAPTPEGE